MLLEVLLHPSILKIKENTNFSACFLFHKRGSTLSTKQFRPHETTQKFNDIILTSLFQEQLKYNDIISAFQNNSQNDKRNYNAVCIVPKTFKIHESLSDK